MYKGPQIFIPNHFYFLECSWDGGDCCGDDVNTRPQKNETDRTLTYRWHSGCNSS